MIVATLKGSWVESLDNLLWLIRTTPKIATEETLFSLVHGSESIAPTKIAVPTHRMQYFNPEANDIERWTYLDLIEEN